MTKFKAFILPTSVRSARMLSVIVRAHWGLLLVLLLALLVRVSLFVWSYGFPTGDVWNFVGIADGLSRFDYPENEKRLPLYPLLILILHTIAPWFSWEGIAVFIALVASLAVLVLLYAIGRALELRKTALCIALLFLVSFRPFLTASLRGYADTTFLALLLGAMLTVLALPRTTAVSVLGPLLAVLALTRYEGVAAGGALLLVALIRLRGLVRRAAVLVLLAALTVSPYVALMRANGRSLLPVAYLEEAGKTSYGVTSVQAFLRNYQTIWERQGLFEVWKVPWGFLRHAARDPFSLPKWLTDLVREPKQAAALLAIPGFAFLLWRRPTGLVTVAVPFFAAVVPVAWYATYERYDMFIFPLMALGAGAGLHVLGVLLSRATTVDRAGILVRRGSIAVVFLFATFVWMLAQTQQSQRGLVKHRGSALAYYQALHFVRHVPGRVALETENSATYLYFRERGTYAGNLLRSAETPTERWDALRRANVELVVTTPSREARFAFVREPIPKARAEEFRRFTAVQADGRMDAAIVYRILFDP